MQTLSFDDDLPSPTVPQLAPRTAATIRAQVAGGILARGAEALAAKYKG